MRLPHAIADVGDRIHRDGCECIWPVLQCAHYGDDIIRFEDWGDDCLVGKQFAVWTLSSGPALYYGDSFDDALAAFERAELRLLGREP